MAVGLSRVKSERVKSEKYKFPVMAVGLSRVKSERVKSGQYKFPVMAVGLSSVKRNLHFSLFTLSLFTFHFSLFHYSLFDDDFLTFIYLFYMIIGNRISKETALRSSLNNRGYERSEHPRQTSTSLYDDPEGVAGYVQMGHSSRVQLCQSGIIAGGARSARTLGYHSEDRVAVSLVGQRITSN